MPKFSGDLVKYVQTFLERTYERCRTSYMEAWTLFYTLVYLLGTSLLGFVIYYYLDFWTFYIMLCFSLFLAGNLQNCICSCSLVHIECNYLTTEHKFFLYIETKLTNITLYTILKVLNFNFIVDPHSFFLSLYPCNTMTRELYFFLS